MSEKSGHGAVLVFVIWAMALIGAVVAACLGRSIVAVMRARELTAEAEGRALAEAGLARFLARFLADEDGRDGPGEEWLPAESSFSADGRSGIRVVDLGSRLDLNSAGEAALLAFFGGAREPVDAVLDWRDEDREPRPAGAEADYYVGLDPPRRPADGFFLCPEEVLLVKGLGEMAPVIEEEATIFGRANPNLVPVEVFHGLLRAAGAEGWEAEAITAQFERFREEARTASRVPFKEEGDLHRLPALSGRLITALAPALTFTGQINPNFAGERTLAAGLAELGLGPEKVRAILAGRPFSDLAGFAAVIAAGEAKLKRDWIAQVFTLETTLVGVEAVGRPPAGGEYRIEAVFERFHPPGESRRWRARLLYRREGYTPVLLAADGGSEESIEEEGSLARP